MRVCPRHWREGKGLWPHEGVGWKCGGDEQAQGYGRGESPDNGVGEQKEGGMS